jgi:hypothetical protein
MEADMGDEQDSPAVADMAMEIANVITRRKVEGMTPTQIADALALALIDLERGGPPWGKELVAALAALGQTSSSGQ